MEKYDLIIIGAGSGGYACAERSADLGLKVAIVEMREFGTGGTCVIRGCIPTKAFAKSAEIMNVVKDAGKYGINIPSGMISADVGDVQHKKDETIIKLHADLNHDLIEKRGVEMIDGKAQFINCKTIVVYDEATERRKVLSADNFVIATGSEPANIPSFHVDRKKIITSDEAVELTKLPKTMTIVGSGAMGLEFAYIFSTFGVEVTLCERNSHIIPAMDEEYITDAVEEYMRSQIKVNIIKDTPISEIFMSQDGKTVCRLGEDKRIESDMTLVTAGRKINTSDLNLDIAGVELDARNRVIIDDHMKTNVDNIYAVGDITEGPQLSYKAQRQGIVAAENIAGINTSISYDVIPWAIFIHPEVSGVGLTEKQAKERGYMTDSVCMPFSENEKAVCSQETTGLVKLVTEKESHKLLGAQLFGTGADLIIQEVAIALDNHMTTREIIANMHVHPALSEIIVTCAKALERQSRTQ